MCGAAGIKASVTIPSSIPSSSPNWSSIASVAALACLALRRLSSSSMCALQAASREAYSPSGTFCFTPSCQWSPRSAQPGASSSTAHERTGDRAVFFLSSGGRMPHRWVRTP